MKISALLFALLMLCGCHKEYLYYTKVHIENHSKHGIEITVTPPVDDRILPQTLRLQSGETFTGVHGTNGGFGFPFVMRKARITFDDSVSITHDDADKSTYHNFCDEHAYRREEPRKRTEMFTFIFTDQDYEYAKEHPNLPPEPDDPGPIVLKQVP